MVGSVGRWCSIQFPKCPTSSSVQTNLKPNPNPLSAGAKLPQLYNGWFDGSIVNDMSAAVKAALKDGVQRAEIICPPIPNVEVGSNSKQARTPTMMYGTVPRLGPGKPDRWCSNKPLSQINICPTQELDFGTALNQQYNQQLAARLKANEKQSRKNLLAFANVDWANRVAQKLGKRALLAAFDGTVPASGVTLCKNAEYVCVSVCLCVWTGLRAVG